MNIPCNEVAQVLREAQIAIQDKNINEVTFILTNSIDWSFGLAEKEGEKIRIAWTTRINIKGDADLVTVYKLFKKILT